MKPIRPCKKCTYKLGNLKTLTNPCTKCRFKNHNMYEIFKDGNISQDKSNIQDQKN